MQIIWGYDRLLIIILCLFITHGRNSSKGSKKGCLKSFITFWRIEYLNSGSDKEPQISKIKKGPSITYRTAPFEDFDADINAC